MTSDVNFLSSMSKARVSSSLSLAGLLVLIGTLVYSYVQMRNLETQVASRQREIIDLVRTREGVTKQVAALSGQVAALEQAKTKLIDELNEAKAEDLGGVIAPKVRVRILPELKNSYHYTIWLEGEESIMERISRVRYDISSTPKIPNVKISHDRESDFAVTFDSPSCLTAAPVEVFTDSGKKSYMFYLDLCKEAGKGPQPIDSN